MWGLFALRTRHPPPNSPSVYRGSTRGAGEGVEKTPPSLRATSSINRGGILDFYFLFE